MTQIQRSLFASAVFLVIAGGALSYATWDKRKRVSDEEHAEEEKKPFPTLKASDVTEVELTRNGTTVLAEKTGPNWTITAPQETAGDDAALEGIASAVVDMSFKKRLKDEDVEARVVDLENPGMRVTVKTKAGTAAQVWVGKRNTFDQTFYVRAGEVAAKAPMAMVGEYAVAPFEKTFFDLREKRVLTVNTADVEALEVATGEGVAAAAFKAVRVVKNGNKQWDDTWQLTAPVQGAADRDEVNRALQALGAARALAFVDEEGKDLAAYGLDKPRFTITVNAGGKTTTVLLGQSKRGAATKHFMKRSDAPNVAEIADAVELGITRDLFSWRDKRVLDFDRDAVKAIATTLPDGTALRLEKAAGVDGSPDSWRVTSPKPGPAKAWKTSSLLYALSSFKVSRFVKEGGVTSEDLEHHGLKNPSRTVQLLGADGKELAVLLLGKEENGQVFVMGKGATFLGAVDKGRLEELPKKAEDYQMDSKEETEGEE